MTFPHRVDVDYWDGPGRQAREPSPPASANPAGTTVGVVLASRGPRSGRRGVVA